MSLTSEFSRLWISYSVGSVDHNVRSRILAWKARGNFHQRQDYHNPFSSSTRFKITQRYKIDDSRSRRGPTAPTLSDGSESSYYRVPISLNCPGGESMGV
ncbi:hypothetical protein CEXT_106141 [Caerostris extrusa]|uniref:Uncharacterized protein n=1 Tax=Caerostris extrusa TaxID=172846 RepID=A0AAV4QLV4_CAEEX|nr:hypothetical protein CEXT_106141 [Caerostris extrusa]